MSDREIMRKLASDYKRAADDKRNGERIQLYKAVNDLKCSRPVVLIDEIPWNEIKSEELVLHTGDATLRRYEDMMRKRLFQWKYFPADMVIEPFLPVYKHIHSTGIGIKVDQNIIENPAGGNIISHLYKDVLPGDEALEKLHPPVYSEDKTGTERDFNILADAVGDIIPLKLHGGELQCFFWDDIARYRGVDKLFTELIDNPDFMHRIVAKLLEFFLFGVRQFESLNLFEPDLNRVHCTAASTDSLKPDDYSKITAKNMWGRGMAQIFASVGPAMHEEFDIEYMKKAMEPFGLVYYGCCEPLHNKIDIVEKLPNLRKISVTPWADVDIAAERIGKKYVLASKPNPAYLSAPSLNEYTVRSEFIRIKEAIRRNSCSADIVLKDISTIGGNLENLIKWEKIAMEVFSDKSIFVC